MADKRISQLIERTDILNNDVLPIVASGATTTNKVTISTIQNWMQDNLDVGVTSVGITLGSSGTDVNVTGSPITTSGNITINIPSASATNRGLLSAADWSTFNGKQNSITLTTSGTSGAATLVGSTLNIPNYSTGVANAYVPYVGAIGSVTLGYNSLSASQINIDGASPTGGSYLGFKHSTSVNTGTDGYTSMYTFGTNTIAFKSVSGGNSKDFSFSMVGITPNVAGGRQYTLPDASGTLALTSDLSGYVTLGTTQTITGSKTFNSKIIGQDATLTSSGSTNTLEVFHTSGSGHAVEIQKAGNGEGLRVIKTSGSGNAVTISGGLLSAEAATLTGALNGTTASFTGAITSTGTGLNPSLRLTNTTASTGTDWHLYSLNNGNLGIFNNTAGAYSLQISSTGVATFTGNTVAANGSVNIEAADPALRFRVTGGTANSRIYEWRAVAAGGANDIMQLRLWNDAQSSASTLMSVTPTGAATFSSSVQATNMSIGIAPQTDKLFVYNASGTNTGLTIQQDGTGDIFRANGNGGANRLVIQQGGNVGIGTSSPGQKLAVSDSGGVTRVLVENTGNAAAGAGLQMLVSSSGTTVGNGTIRTDNADNMQFFNIGGERMRITSSGNVGIGTSSPTYKLVVSNGGAQGIEFDTGTIIAGRNYLINYNRSTSAFVDLSIDANNIFFTGNGTERMRITSGGDVLINKQTLSGGSVGVEFERNSSTRMTTDGNTVLLLNRLSSDGTIVDIRRSGTQVGTISVTTTATSYNTSSDYRLKENVKPVENALSVLTQLKPCTFNFIADTDEEVIGFIAHEVQEVIPQAVTGEKDAVRIEQVEVSPAELDEEGNVITEAVIEEKEVPVYQGIDHSKLVPLLVAAIQEQQEQIKLLTEQIEALKSQING